MRRGVARAALLSALLLGSSSVVNSMPYYSNWTDYNLNTNEGAGSTVTDYSGSWSGHDYYPSPTNWRALPVYTIILDRWLDGSPDRNDVMGTMYEYDVDANELRHGGDIQGLLSGNYRSLDYLQGAGYGAIYLAGTPFINMPWGSDGYSPLDFTLLDPHFGTIDDWRDMVTEVHRRGMYIIVDFTVGTMGDFVGFKGYLNTSTPFTLNEHDAVWKPATYGPITQYPDFAWSNVKNSSCVLPDFYNQDGTKVTTCEGETECPTTHTGCYDSEFDHYGDTEAFGTHPDWQRELSKFASVQDRLREWKPSVAAKLEVFGCLIISMLDIDGIRIDKATQMTVAALADWASTTRTCATKLGKTNFFIPGEITGGNNFGSIYLGRGRQPDQVPSAAMAPVLTPSEGAYFMRDEGKQALDGAAFHYSIYRSLTRTLGMDGNLSVAYDVDVDFVNAWNVMLTTNDFLNPSTGDFDPRHLYGVGNQDVFRWPSLINGTRKNLFGTFITTLLLPGIPLTYYGEEQAMYLYDSQATNYLYGRQPMGSNIAWQKHGCYALGDAQYHDMPFNKGTNGALSDGCNDDWNSQDHLDPTAPGRIIMARMLQLRKTYPALLDGFSLQTRGNWTSNGYLPGSNTTATEFGVWSVERGPLTNQTFTGTQANTTVWLLYSNLNDSTTITQDCTGADGIMTPYQSGVAVTNLFHPYDNITLSTSPTSYYLNGLAPYRGCAPSISLVPHGFAAYVPTANWVAPLPVLTGFLPGHDARLTRGTVNATNIDLVFQYSTAMSCDSISTGLTLTSERSNATATPTLDKSSVVCGPATGVNVSDLNGAPPTAWAWSGTIINADDGIYMFSLSNVTSSSGTSTGTTDNLLVRKGLETNIMIFPASTAANYYNPLLTPEDGHYYLNHQSYGASSFRWSSDYGQNWSPWNAWESRTQLEETDFNTTDMWDGKHVKVQYHSELAASSDHVVEADAEWDGVGTRRIPTFLLRGKYNDWGYDNGLSYKFKRNTVGAWTINIMMTWPTYFHVMPISGLKNLFYGDVDNDGILDRLQPTSQSYNYMNVSEPTGGHLGYQLIIDEASLRWHVVPRGSQIVQIILFFLLALVPPLTAVIAVVAYRRAFYTVTYNRVGVAAPRQLPLWFTALSSKSKRSDFGSTNEVGMLEKKSPGPDHAFGDVHDGAIWPDDPDARRKVLIATLEYELIGVVPPIKVKIGGLGVMSSLMGKAMTDVDMIWVVPKVKDIEYPPFTPTDPILVKIFDEEYPISVENYVVDSITYYILDSPVFRAQTKSDPYPARMDDLESAIFYSTWNQCVAEVMRRTPNLSIYHINDYHATAAPLYLLPQIIPVCMSLHNAEFQGLWPLRTEQEQAEVSKVYNLPRDVVERYVQFGNTFNLLHAGAAYIALHQASTGVAGVSDKYGKRSWARYPALWTLKKIDSLPNPDPTDIEALDETPLNAKSVKVDEAAERKRPEYRRQAQAWAGLEEDPSAELFVFVGRWSKQKGVDLIADIFPSILEKNPKVQLITVGPVVDLYGRFAAEKLARLMKIFPGRTALPPFLFQGAEFALIPSRDEPFGLVAVEFGRKGALGVGSRLGGLGLAPGWWFNVESDSTVHMLSQFAKTIKAALKSTPQERAVLRARSAVQRFPVLEWRQRTEDLHKRSILASRKGAKSLAFNWDDIDQNEPPTLHTYPPNQHEAPQSPGPGQMVHSQSASYGSAYSPMTPGTPNTPGDISPRQPLFHLPGRGHDRNSTSSRSHPLQTNITINEDSEMENDDYFGQLDRFRDSTASGADTPYGGMSGANTPTSPYPPSSGRPSDAPGSFLARANTRLERQITKSRKGRTRDPLFAPEADPSMAGPQSPGLNTPKIFGNSSFANSVDSLNADDDEPLTAPTRKFDRDSRRQSTDSISAIMSEKSESPLNIALASFTDADGMVTREFVAKMSELDPSNSMKDDFCIEKYLIKQEKVFFDHVRKEKRTAAKAAFKGEGSTAHDDTMYDLDHQQRYSVAGGNAYDDAPRPGPAVQLPDRLQLFLMKDLWGWPIYCIILALGQTLGASSFQLVLIGGSSTQSNEDLYIIGGVYLAATFVWYTLYTFYPLRHTLSLPFLMYGIAFLVVGLPSASEALHPWHIRHSLTMAATCVYSFASAAGWAFFSFNFGEEGGVQTSSWVFRACVVQGTQQIWLAALWFWGFKLSGKDSNSSVPSIYILCATIPLACMSFVLSYVLLKGLPGFYRQVPGHITNFIATLARRKLVLWFLFSQILSNYWLSSPYGKSFNLSSSGKPQLHTWVVVILAAFFFIVVWGVLLTFLSWKSKEHTWYLPIFAVGLGAPRWCQMLWGTSSIGLYLPWAGVAGPYISTCLWLWLGVLDSIQGVGLGMMLLQTLSRVHVGAALASAQVVGTVVTIVARATAPDNSGPGSVFPNFGLWNPHDPISETPFAKWAFWFAAICQFVIVFGYLVLFRGEQLSKP
ncbi:hypothetical protein RQP46_005592 [Phenoliferia psychrophenolica]